MSSEIIVKEEVVEDVVIEKNEKKQRGAGLIEYALLAAIVVGIAVVARTTLSTSASKAFSGVDSATNATLN
jgi:Flp pilus assembly pilin Flp